MTRPSCLMMTSFCVLLLLLVAGRCHGEDKRANHLVLLETLPEGVSLNRATYLDVRTNFSGTVKFVESSEFRVVVNITAPDLQAAYKINADLVSMGDGLLLQVSEQDTAHGVVTLVWLGVAIAGATVLLMVVATVYACCWYRRERSLYDLAEKKSVAGSSQRGVYRSRNSLQVVNLPPLGELPIPPTDRDDVDGLHNDDSLKQVPEMPEEEEAEAIEMEELTFLKLKEMDSLDPTSNESSPHRLTPQERNLVKNQLHSQNKNIHKDLLKKDKPSKPSVREKPVKQPAKRRTATGLYTGVASGPELAHGSTDDSMDSENDVDLDLSAEIIRELGPSEPSYENTPERKQMSTFMSPQRHARQAASSGPAANMEASKRGYLKLDNLSHADQDNADSELQVMADVHKVGQPEMFKVSTPDKQTHPGFGGNLSCDVPRPNLSTFNSPAQGTPANQGKSIRFKEPEESSDKPLPPPVPAKPGTSARFAPGFLAMGDIPEDPREDCDSVQSESGRSRSLYGSSEIFDANNPEHTYYNLEDSDIDIPPLDAEDFFSDGGLPSPLITSLGHGHTKDDSSLSGPRSVFFGRGSPYMGIPKPRPYSSIIPRTDHNRPMSDSGMSSGMSSGISSDQTSTPINSEVDSGSPQLPPPPLPEEDLNQDGSAFRFPPPPSYFSLPHKGSSWTGSSPHTVSAGEYVTLPNNSTKAAMADTRNRTNNSAKESRQGGGGGGGRAGFGSKFTHLTVLCALGVLTLTTGVYCRLTADDADDTRADITIFAPLSFLSAKNNTVYFNLNKNTELEMEGSFKLVAYVMPDPVLMEKMPVLCTSSKCEHGCDTQTGKCICFKGYRLIGTNLCVDINECAEGFTNCHPSAGCLNRRGSYNCVCSVDYYGDGKTCHDCNTPCRQDQYEDQPCSKTEPKICKGCTKTCHKGYYMASLCTDFTNAVCRVCQPPCVHGQYEYRTCSNYHDRQCLNVSHLPDVEVSDNVIVEEDRKVKESEVTIEHLPNLSVGYTRYSLKRGTGLHVDISIQKMEAAQQFVPLNLTDITLTASPPPLLRSNAVQQLCPHPVPDHYILHYTKHQDVTYQLDEDDGEITPCQTYKKHGNFPKDTDNKDQSFLCHQPGALSKLFEIHPDIFLTSTHWAEKSKRCRDNSERCEQCTRRCAQNMVAGSRDCSVVGDDGDNGWSPRLQVCYNCCARRNCSNSCHNYHRRRCQPAMCLQGNLVQFSLFQSWDSSKDGKFFCHIQPLPRQPLLDMTYTVRSEGRQEPVHTAKVKVFGEDAWDTQGRVLHRDKLLNILIDSHLGKLPDFLEGQITADRREFHVGNYIRQGSRVESTVVSSESLRIHPLNPFGVGLNRTDPEKCEKAILKESLIAAEHQSPYTPNHELLAVTTTNSSVPYTITRLHQPPTVRISADSRSFLNAMFPAATLETGTLTGRMTQNDTHWLVEILATVTECPGYLRVVLSDPAYRSTPLYSCDVAITCPRDFHLRFHLPTGDSSGLDRQVVASLEDSRHVHHLRLHRPARSDVIGEEKRKPVPTMTPTVTPAPMKQDEATETVPLPEGFIFSIPYMVSVGGAVFLLLCLLIIGLIVQPGVPAPEPPILRCHHALFMVIYIIFHFLYSVIATSSVFFLVIIAVNSPRVAFLQQYQQQSVATSASHQLELTAMRTYLERELQRQATHMDSMRALCRQDMQLIVGDMHKLHKEVLQQTEEVFQKHKLEVLLEQHRHSAMQQLSQDLLSFRDRYNQAVRIMLSELNHNVRQAHRSLENNTWLAGARFLHGVVTTTRKHINNVDSKPFMEWAHLHDDLSKLIVDVSFSLPSLPKLADIEEVMEKEEPQPSKRSKANNPTSDQVRRKHVYNQWFAPFSTNTTWDVVRQQSSGYNRKMSEDSRSFTIFHVLLVVMACVDVVLVLHRMLKAKIVGHLLLYGFPEYMDFRERKGDVGDDDVFSDRKKCQCWSESPFCQALKAFLYQLISSTFVPKAVMVVAAALLLRGVLHVSTSLLTVQSLQKAGFYHSSEEYLDLHSQLINGRLQAHAFHINTVDFPAYQTWMSAYIQRHQFAFQVYQQQFQRMQEVHTRSYCHYLQSLALAGNCSTNTGEDNSQDSAHGIISPACQFQPVLPKLYKRSESIYQNLSEQQLEVMLNTLRSIILDTCQISVVFLSIVVLKELLCAVVWIFIRRSGLIRLRIIYETDQDDPAPTG